MNVNGADENSSIRALSLLFSRHEEKDDQRHATIEHKVNGLLRLKYQVWGAALVVIAVIGIGWSLLRENIALTIKVSVTQAMKEERRQ